MMALLKMHFLKKKKVVGCAFVHCIYTYTISTQNNGGGTYTYLPMYYIYEKFLMRVMRIHFFPTTKVTKNGIILEKLLLEHEYKLQHFIHNVYL